MVNVGVRRPARGTAAIVVAGAVLGLLAFTVDAVDGTARQVMTALVSSGLAWGSAAVLAGHTAPDRRSAVTRATLLLISATLVYYLLILVISRRWSGGVLVDGSSADWYGLRSLAVMTTAWSSVSMVAGPALGLLGLTARTGRLRSAALAAGASCGLLSGEGWSQIAAAPPWRLLAVDGPDAAFARGVLAAELVGVIVPLAVLACLVSARRLWGAWHLMAIATGVTATLSAVLWHLVRVAANHLG
ncbi:hypothetical protein [Actinoplanes utahensis]|uniref:hypothetical protein n=1 Tax=Actinoplanes utahensis TaxID=1869 RepID=UPI000ACA7727|nr:hypothetical protein [Actinoplanes utahensis]GIF34005.1 hypothetical protein Aut01nite_69910 [Actinoplanes utahensis]